MTKRTPGPEPFNNPFQKVKLTEPTKAEPSKPPPARKDKPVRSSAEGPVALDAEAAMFLEAMGEVVPTQVDRKHQRDQPRVDPVKAAHEESESLALLAELVAGDGKLQVHGAEGWVPGLDPQVIARLRQGAFRVDARHEQGELEQFIVHARRAGHRCVLVKGDSAALTRGRVARHVLAFCSVADAVWVLLRH